MVSRAIALLAVFALTPLLAASPVDAESGDTAEAAATYRWESPADHKGPLAIRMTLDFGASQECTRRLEMSGVGGGRDGIHSWEEWDGIVSAFSSSYYAGAHARGSDMRTVYGEGGAWSLSGSVSGTYKGVHTLTLVNFQARTWTSESTGTHPAIVVEWTCDRDLTTRDFFIGYEAIPFKPDHMRGGDGASADVIVLSAGVNRGDEVRATFKSPLVTVHVRERSSSSEVSGQLQLTRPSAFEVLTLRGSMDHRAVDGPGNYRVQLDRVAAGSYHSLLGAMYGLAPVTALPGSA